MAKMANDELWAKVPGFPNHRVSSFGKVQTRQIRGADRIGEWTDMKIGYNRGYPIVVLAYKKNNHISNLEWVTPRENTRHAFSLGLIDRKGGKNSQSKLDDKKIKQIREYLKKGMTNNAIAKKFEVATSRISDIRNNKAWIHVV